MCSSDLYEERFNFFLGYYAADGGKCPGEKSKSIRFSNKGKIGTAHLYYLVRSLGYQSSLSIRSDKPDIFRISCCIGDIGVRKQRVVNNKIKKNIYIKNTENNEYVYDLETEEGIFNAGIGEIIVKNTDSVFIDFGLKKDGEYYETKEALEFAIDLGVIGGNFIKMKMHPPQDLEYEKTFWPFCILSKKRYVGNKYEFDKNKFKQNSMGIVLKRRDNARIVKKVVGGMVDILLNEVNVEKAVNYIKKSIINLLKGKYPLHNFVTSKIDLGDFELQSSIKNENNNNVGAYGDIILSRKNLFFFVFKIRLSIFIDLLLLINSFELILSSFTFSTFVSKSLKLYEVLSLSVFEANNATSYSGKECFT